MNRNLRRQLDRLSDLLCTSRFLLTYLVLILPHTAMESSAGTASENGVKMRFENIKKSPNDNRVYRGLILNNDMKVLLISDSTTDRSAASLHVNVGFMSDPAGLPGLAHLCKHMVLLGTQKYPNNNEFYYYVSEHGGHLNASTLLDRTVYYFDIVPNKLEEALDRFSQCFHKPLFAESMMAPVINVINSEHNTADDSIKFNQLHRSSADPEHPFSKFKTGNEETLYVNPKKNGINVRDQLLKFHGAWYSANIMALSVIGRESLNDLEKMIVKMFAEVPNKRVKALECLHHPFNKNHYGHKWFIVPMADIRLLKVFFPLPKLQEHYKADPTHYISHLLGHEGDGSLLSALTKKGWANNLSAQEDQAARGEVNFFTVLLNLTEEGVDYIDIIISLMFQYINMLKSEDPIRWFFEEHRQIEQMHFNFGEKLPLQSYVNATAEALHKYQMEDVLIAPCYPSEWRPDLIKLVIDHLSPQNIRIHVIGKEFEPIATETEIWYGTKFKKEKIPDSVLMRWSDDRRHEELKFPTKNELIPTSFEIKPIDRSTIEKFPVIIEDNPFMRVWFKQDDKFLVPKVNLIFEFATPLANSDPLSCNLTFMYIELVKDSLNEYSYNASLAGLNWDFTDSKYGASLSVDGYDDKHRILLEKIMDKMVNFTVDKQRFEILKEEYTRTLKDHKTEKPSDHAVYYLAVLLAEQVWTNDELLDAADDITVEKLEAFVPQLLSKMHVESLVYGNLTKAEALESVRLVQSKLTADPTNRGNRTLVPLLPKHMLPYREINLEEGCHFLYEVEDHHHKSSCTEVYYQSGLQSTESNVQLELLVRMITKPCCKVLETKENPESIIHCKVRRSNGVQGLTFMVENDEHPQYVEEKIDAFIESILGRLVDMPDPEFSQHKMLLTTEMLEKFKTMTTLFESFWNEISTQQYNFDRVNIEAQYLRTITKEQIINFFKVSLYI
ncbi:insulin-degrading enzyme-like, partial [Fopius arisanus]|uniref:Insulin-degrading enzyme-like n=1 Tax=Fopius arisanus TaxID=64838 RepID=A0A9R1UAT6_9HYME